MSVRKLAVVASVIGVAVWHMVSLARADIVVLKDPDAWMQQTIDNIGDQKFDEVTRDFFRMIGKPVDQPFAASLRELGPAGKPAFIEKASDSKFGGVLRQVTWLALYRETNYVYFSFIFKKNRGGYAITDFRFKSEASGLFPQGYYTPQ
jgi:hypothetical protein